MMISRSRAFLRDVRVLETGGINDMSRYIFGEAASSGSRRVVERCSGFVLSCVRLTVRRYPGICTRGILSRVIS